MGGMDGGAASCLVREGTIRVIAGNDGFEGNVLGGGGLILFDVV